MNEKKLTDEEVVNALEFCINNVCSLGCPMRSDTSCVQTLRISALDLIHRLQEDNKNYDRANSELMCTIAEQKAEIERLTEELKNCGQELIESNREQEELQDRNDKIQKQVDELKIKTCPNSDYCGGRIQQAVKDTAKEIYGEIDDSDILVVETQEYGEIEVVPMGRLKEIVKSKGVEVE